MYLDENNLYGWGMSQYLPYCEFKLLKNTDKFDVNSIGESSSIGYILEVDLKYPDELYYLHNYYTLAPENLQFLMTHCQILVKKLLINMD